MTLHVYAVAEHPAALPSADGIGGAEVKAVRVAALDVLASAVDGRVPGATEQEVLAHARVVEEAAAVNDALLPARFGAALAGEDAVVEAIRPREQELLSALGRVQGNVELGLRVLGVVSAPKGAPGSGAAYMTARLEQVRSAERAAADIHEPLAASARESTLQVLATPELLLTAAYLVPRGEVDAFRERVEALGRGHEELTFVCTGPWPPYSFATVRPEAP